MSITLKVVLIVAAVCVFAFAAWAAVYFAKKIYAKKEDEKVEKVPAETPIVEEPAIEEVATEEVAVAKQTVEEIEETEEDELAITDLEDEEDDREIYTRVRTFSEKMLDLDVRTQEYYDKINNEFNSYRKINDRISKKCMSYRFGRKLIAKLTVRGKTMKFHLALDVKDFPENIYFQKDLSEVKSYVETPFTVKVKSDRGLKKALDLLAALMEKEGVEKKVRCNPIDSMEEIRHIVMESNADMNE